MSSTLKRPRTARTLRKDLHAIWVDGLAFSVMVGVGETYIPAFALALGCSSLSAGLIATLPMLAGALAQLVSPLCVKRLGSHRRWVVVCVSVQAASFLPLSIAACAGRLPQFWLFACASLYWGSGLASGPAWNTWVETLVPRTIRIEYFARRTRWLHVFAILGLCCGGWILQAGSLLAHPLHAFALIFLIALCARTLSACLLARQSEPLPVTQRMHSIGLFEFAGRLRHGRDGRLLFYMFSVQFTVQIAAPYFTPYMLGPLHFSYVRYMSLIAAAVLAKFASLPLHARLARRFGTRTLLWIGGLGIVPASALWIFCETYAPLLVAQLFAGAVWAAWELSTFLLFFDAIAREERTSMLTNFNLANACAIAIGSACGGMLLATFGRGREAFIAVFAVSLALRFATLISLRRLEPVRASVRVLPTETDALRPSAGSLEEPILPGIGEDQR